MVLPPTAKKPKTSEEIYLYVYKNFENSPKNLTNKNENTNELIEIYRHSSKNKDPKLDDKSYNCTNQERYYKKVDKTPCCIPGKRYECLVYDSEKSADNIDEKKPLYYPNAKAGGLDPNYDQISPNAPDKIQPPLSEILHESKPDTRCRYPKEEQCDKIYPEYEDNKYCWNPVKRTQASEQVYHNPNPECKEENKCVKATEKCCKLKEKNTSKEIPESKNERKNYCNVSNITESRASSTHIKPKIKEHKASCCKRKEIPTLDSRKILPNEPDNNLHHYSNLKKENHAQNSDKLTNIQPELSLGQCSNKRKEGDARDSGQITDTKADQLLGHCPIDSKPENGHEKKQHRSSSEVSVSDSIQCNQKQQKASNALSLESHPEQISQNTKEKKQPISFEEVRESKPDAKPCCCSGKEQCVKLDSENVDKKYCWSPAKRTRHRERASELGHEKTKRESSKDSQCLTANRECYKIKGYDYKQVPENEHVGTDRLASDVEKEEAESNSIQFNATKQKKDLTDLSLESHPEQISQNTKDKKQPISFEEVRESKPDAKPCCCSGKEEQCVKLDSENVDKKYCWSPGKRTRHRERSSELGHEKTKRESSKDSQCLTANTECRKEKDVLTSDSSESYEIRRQRGLHRIVENESNLESNSKQILGDKQVKDTNQLCCIIEGSLSSLSNQICPSNKDNNSSVGEEIPASEFGKIRQTTEENNLYPNPARTTDIKDIHRIKPDERITVTKSDFQQTPDIKPDKILCCCPSKRKRCHRQQSMKEPFINGIKESLVTKRDEISSHCSKPNCSQNRNVNHENHNGVCSSSNDENRARNTSEERDYRHCNVLKPKRTNSLILEPRINHSMCSNMSCFSNSRQHSCVSLMDIRGFLSMCSSVTICRKNSGRKENKCPRSNYGSNNRQKHKDYRDNNELKEYIWMCPNPSCPAKAETMKYKRVTNTESKSKNERRNNGTHSCYCDKNETEYLEDDLCDCRNKEHKIKRDSATRTEKYDNNRMCGSENNRSEYRTEHDNRSHNCSNRPRNSDSVTRTQRRTNGKARDLYFDDRCECFPSFELDKNYCSSTRRCLKSADSRIRTRRRGNNMCYCNENNDFEDQSSFQPDISSECPNVHKCIIITDSMTKLQRRNCKTPCDRQLVYKTSSCVMDCPRRQNCVKRNESSSRSEIGDDINSLIELCESLSELEDDSFESQPQCRVKSCHSTTKINNDCDCCCRRKPQCVVEVEQNSCDSPGLKCRVRTTDSGTSTQIKNVPCMSCLLDDLGCECLPPAGGCGTPRLFCRVKTSESSTRTHIRNDIIQLKGCRDEKLNTECFTFLDLPNSDCDAPRLYCHVKATDSGTTTQIKNDIPSFKICRKDKALCQALSRLRIHNKGSNDPLAVCRLNSNESTCSTECCPNEEPRYPALLDKKDNKHNSQRRQNSTSSNQYCDKQNDYVSEYSSELEIKKRICGSPCLGYRNKSSTSSFRTQETERNCPCNSRETRISEEFECDCSKNLGEEGSMRPPKLMCTNEKSSTTIVGAIKTSENSYKPNEYIILCPEYASQHQESHKPKKMIMKDVQVYPCPNVTNKSKNPSEPRDNICFCCTPNCPSRPCKRNDSKTNIHREGPNSNSKRSCPSNPIRYCNIPLCPRKPVSVEEKCLMKRKKLCFNKCSPLIQFDKKSRDRKRYKSPPGCCHKEVESPKSISSNTRGIPCRRCQQQ